MSNPSNVGRDMGVIAQVCRTWNRVSNDDALWKHVLQVASYEVQAILDNVRPGSGKPQKSSAMKRKEKKNSLWERMKEICENQHCNNMIKGRRHRWKRLCMTTFKQSTIPPPPPPFMVGLIYFITIVGKLT